MMKFLSDYAYYVITKELKKQGLNANNAFTSSISVAYKNLHKATNPPTTHFILGACKMLGITMLDFWTYPIDEEEYKEITGSSNYQEIKSFQDYHFYQKKY